MGQILKIILIIMFIDSPSVRIYVNKIENRIIFKTNAGYYLKLLVHETIKLLGSTNTNMAEDKNSENVPHLEINEAALDYCNIVNNDYQ